MSDAFQTAILAAFSAALERAISQAVATHVEDLQARLDALADRTAKLEGDISHNVQVQQANIVAALAERIAKLEREAAEAATAVGSVLGAELRAVKGRLDELEATDARDLTKDQVREIAEAAAEEAIDAHCSDYDHDEYDNHIGDDDKHSDEDSIESAVREALDGLSVTLSL